jgi:hypothetical protein
VLTAVASSAVEWKPSEQKEKDVSHSQLRAVPFAAAGFLITQPSFTYTNVGGDDFAQVNKIECACGERLWAAKMRTSQAGESRSALRWPGTCARLMLSQLLLTSPCLTFDFLTSYFHSPLGPAEGFPQPGISAFTFNLRSSCDRAAPHLAVASRSARPVARITRRHGACGVERSVTYPKQTRGPRCSRVIHSRT